MPNDAGVTVLEPIVVTAPAKADNSGNATFVHGKAKWQSCWRQACYLAKYIYKDPAPAGGFQTQFPEKMAQVESTWEKWDELVQQGDNGLVARLFKVKGYDPSSATEVCPPCLVYRGTDFDDMRDLAVSIVASAAYGPFSRNLGKVFVLDTTVNKDQTRDQLVTAGYTPISIYEEKGETTAQLTAGGFSVNLDVEVKLEILAKENGDWLNNVQQGLGRGSVQYKNAISFGLDVVRTKVLPSPDRRLEITGHSLGGGLASAVCAVLSRTVREVYFHAIVFNPAGVHPKTLAPATPADGNIDVFSVKDEILTTIQAHRDLVPVLGSVFRLAKRTINQDGMPVHIGNVMQVPGTSPGKSNEHWAVPPKGNALPVLFPINHQTLVPPPKEGGFPEITQLDQLLNGAPSVSLFGTRLLQHLNTRYREGAQEVVPESWWGGRRADKVYTEMLNRYLADIMPEYTALMKVVEASVSYHGMDYVIATYDKRFGGL